MYFKAVQEKTSQAQPGWASAVSWASRALAEAAGAAAEVQGAGLAHSTLNRSRGLITARAGGRALEMSERP